MSKPNPLYSHEDKEIFKPKIFNLPFFVLKLRSKNRTTIKDILMRKSNS